MKEVIELGDESGRNLLLQASTISLWAGRYVCLMSQSHFFDEFCVLAFIARIGAGSELNFVLSSLNVYNEKSL